MGAGEGHSAVVVTGIGLVTPLGATREESWAGIRSGRSATRYVETTASAVPLDTSILGAPVVFPADARFRPTGEPVIDLALHAATEAVDDAKLEIHDRNADRIGCVIGTSKGGLLSIERALSDGGDSTGWMNFPPDRPAIEVSRRFGLRGPSLCSVAACATGVTCLQRGFELIRDGYCDVVLAGSSDASLLSGVAGSYRRLGVIATNFDDPATACRPFERSRSGFVIGEGAAVLVLERKSHAESRGAKPYAEWLAGGTAAEAFDITRLGSDPATLVRLMQDVLRRAGVVPAEIDYCNLHGTATRKNDVYETAAVKAAFGPAADSVSFSSLKGGIGHLLGAAGSVETAITLLAMRDGIVPPTVNLIDPDPACDLDYTANESRDRSIRTAMKISLGFGGHLAAAVLRRS